MDNLGPRVDVWRHPEGWATTVYLPNNTRLLSLDTRLYTDRRSALRDARGLVVMGIATEIYVFSTKGRITRKIYEEQCHEQLYL
jgi:hypothetical protein